MTVTTDPRKTGLYVAPYDGTLNWTSAKLPLLSAAISKARTSPPVSTSALATIDLIGDSTTFSASLNGGAQPWKRTNGWGPRFAEHLAEIGIPALEDSICGAGIYTLVSDITTAETRLSLGAGWVLQNQQSMGGNFFKAPNGVTTAMSFTPTAAFDTIEIEYLKNSAFGSFTVDIGGAALQTVSTAGSLSLGKVLVSTGAGAATGSVNIKGNSTGDVYVFSVRTRNSAARKIEVCNFGWPSSSSGSWINTTLAPYDPMARIAFRAATASVICLGINDWNTPVTDLATYTANMQTLITKCKLTGDVILVAPAQSNPANFASAASQQAYVDSLAALASANNCAFLDLQFRFGAFATANTNGLMADDRHPNAIAADGWGYRAAQLLASV